MNAEFFAKMIRAFGVDPEAVQKQISTACNAAMEMAETQKRIEEKLDMILTPVNQPVLIESKGKENAN